MKVAGIARALVVVTALTLIGTAFAGPAAAAPLKRYINLDTGNLAVDGTDVYWTLAHKRRSGVRESILYRGSFLNRSRVELARFRNETDDNVRSLSAGGGFVVVTLDDEHVSDEGSPASQIVRISRDGTRKDVIASGEIKSKGSSSFEVRNGVGYLNDCGTRVLALDVSESGSVAIATVVSDRSSTACGRKKDVDHWRYYEYRLDGSTREIFSMDVAVRSTFKKVKRGYRSSDTSRVPALSSVEIVGDRAMIRTYRTSRVLVRDLVTGALTGPFGRATRKTDDGVFTSLGTNGALAYNLFGVSKRTIGPLAIGIFPSAADPTVFNKRKGETPLMYCGSHLLSVPFGDGKLKELDPVTFAPVRTISNLLPNASLILGVELGCDENYLYGIDLPERGVFLVAYPLN